MPLGYVKASRYFQTSHCKSTTHVSILSSYFKYYWSQYYVKSMLFLVHCLLKHSFFFDDDELKKKEVLESIFYRWMHVQTQIELGFRWECQRFWNIFVNFESSPLRLFSYNTWNPDRSTDSNFPLGLLADSFPFFWKGDVAGSTND